MKKEKKYWYCKNCKDFPKKIYEKGIVITHRFWDGECYEGKSTEYDDNNLIHYCAKCDTKLIEK